MKCPACNERPGFLSVVVAGVLLDYCLECFERHIQAGLLATDPADLKPIAGPAEKPVEYSPESTVELGDFPEEGGDFPEGGGP